MNFTTFAFDQRIVAGIKSCGYTTPTPIQEQAIPPVLEGHDVLGLAQTGTGKTAAFALPILQRLADNNANKGPSRILVLAPTRELALQIHENFITLGKQTGLRSAVVIGGVGMTPQIKACSRAQIIIACPGRLVRLLDKNTVSLDSINTLVLDEADRMLDMGFMPDIKRVLARLPKKRQNLLFSATMPSDIRKLADTILVNPKTVKVANTKPVESVTHSFYATHDTRKAGILEDLLNKGEHESVLIFTRTKYKAKNLARKLNNRGHESTFLQGNMSQGQRQRALDGFKDGSFKIMVATDIAARGIDCERITHVINYDMPDTVETYTHRIGRTGRAGRSGNAVSLVTRDDKTQVHHIERIMRTKFEQCVVEGGDEPVEDTRTHQRASRPGGQRNGRNGQRNGRNGQGNGRRKPGANAGSRNSQEGKRKRNNRRRKVAA